MKAWRLVSRRAYVCARPYTTRIFLVRVSIQTEFYNRARKEQECVLADSGRELGSRRRHQDNVQRVGSKNEHRNK